MACNCGKNKNKTNTNWTYTAPGGGSSVFRTQVEAMAAKLRDERAGRTGGTVSPAA